MVHADQYGHAVEQSCRCISTRNACSESADALRETKGTPHLLQRHCEPHPRSPSRCPGSPPWSAPWARGTLSCLCPAACRAARPGLQWLKAPQAECCQAGRLHITLIVHLLHITLYAQQTPARGPGRRNAMQAMGSVASSWCAMQGLYIRRHL